MNRFFVKEVWSDQDRHDYGRVLERLRELETQGPPNQVTDRLYMFEVDWKIRSAAIQRWRKEKVENVCRHATRGGISFLFQNLIFTRNML